MINQSEYKEAIKAMRECNLNREQAAKKLFMHSNTLRYRLNRIKEQTGEDPYTIDGILKLCDML